MTNDDGELLNLDHSITEARRHFFRTRDHLHLVVREAGGNEDIAGGLIALAEEFGSEHVSDILAKGPAALGFTKPEQVAFGAGRDRLVDLVTVTSEADRDLCDLVTRRENILCERDPARQRRYSIYGREGIIDVANLRWEFPDEELTEVFILEPVEPRGFPDKTLDAMRVGSALQRKRERKR